MTALVRARRPPPPTPVGLRATSALAASTRGPVGKGLGGTRCVELGGGKAGQQGGGAWSWEAGRRGSKDAMSECGSPQREVVHQRQSVAISGHQWPSVAISGHLTERWPVPCVSSVTAACGLAPAAVSAGKSALVFTKSAACLCRVGEGPAVEEGGTPWKGQARTWTRSRARRTSAAPPSARADRARRTSQCTRSDPCGEGNRGGKEEVGGEGSSKEG